MNAGLFTLKRKFLWHAMSYHWGLNLLEVFFPRHCCGCGRRIAASQQVICVFCIHEIPWTQHHRFTQNQIYTKCYGLLEVEQAAALIYYHKNGLVQELIKHLKYQRGFEVGTYFGSYCGHLWLKHNSNHGITDVVLVPLHKKRAKYRGYNQVFHFGQALADVLGVNFAPEYLMRTVDTKRQTDQDADFRSGMSHENFCVNPQIKLAGNHVLLVDDVITTGATILACGQAIKVKSNLKISLLSIAYTEI